MQHTLKMKPIPWMTSVGLACLLCLTIEQKAFADGSSVSRLIINSSAGTPFSNETATGPGDIILKEIFHRANVPAEVIPTSSERSLSNINHGIDDGDGFRMEGLQSLYPHIVCVPEVISEFEFCVYCLAEHPIKVDGFDDLKLHQIAINRGRPGMLKMVSGARAVIEVNTQEQLFRMLDSGRVEAVLDERSQADFTLKTLDLKTIKRIDPPIASRPIYIYLNEKHASLVPALVAAIKSMKQDGFIDRTLREGGLK